MLQTVGGGVACPLGQLFFRAALPPPAGPGRRRLRTTSRSPTPRRTPPGSTASRPSSRPSATSPSTAPTVPTHAGIPVYRLKPGGPQFVGGGEVTDLGTFHQPCPGCSTPATPDPTKKSRWGRAGSWPRSRGLVLGSARKRSPGRRVGTRTIARARPRRHRRRPRRGCQSARLNWTVLHTDPMDRVKARESTHRPILYGWSL